MKISAKITLAFASLTTIVLLVSGLSLTLLSQSNERFEQYLDGVRRTSVLSSQLRQGVDARAVAARNLVLVTEPGEVEKELSQVKRGHQQVSDSLSQLQKLVADRPQMGDKVRSLVTEIADVERRYSPVALGIVDLAAAGKKSEAVAKMNTECRPLLARMVALSEDFANLADAQSEAMAKASGSAYTLAQTVLAGACLAVLVAAAAACVVLIRSITRPVMTAVDFAERVAGGDLTTRIDANGSDETAQLLRALDKMSKSLAGIVHQVRHGSDSIATGSSEIATGNADLSQRTEEQASNLQQTAAAMEELTGTVQNNAETAQQANRLASVAAAAAASGGEAVGQVVATMQDIAAASRKITDIIGTIDGIAFQTNILALNAAVEAARAGEQGRGFAVVASEVRSLAQRSGQAAREIKALISSSGERVELGARQVNEAGDSMAEIVRQVQQVSQLIGEISNATAEQSRGISQVGDAVGQLDQVTQQNAALVEQSAAAAESLRLQAGRLVQAVAVFKVEP
jgi:methyl-accepting chemotaxis protein